MLSNKIGRPLQESLLALLLSERLGIDVSGAGSGSTSASAEPSAAAVSVREDLRRRLAADASSDSHAPKAPKAA